jgi:hypothetical protein
MASFWNNAEKNAFKAAGLGQITPRTEEGRAIINLIQDSEDIKNIVEIGTWNGLGSTLCIIHGIENKEVKFWSLECNKEKLMSAVDSLSDYIDERVMLLWGSVVDTSVITSEEYLSNFKDLKTSETLQRWFSSDLSNCEVCPNILKELPDNIDFLLLDGGEFTTLYEFECLRSRCSKYIALDDTLIDKCREVRRRLLEDPAWTEIVSISNNGRNGFSIFKLHCR